MRDIKFKVWDTKENKWLTNPKVTAIHHEKSWGNEFYLEVDEDWTAEDYDPTRYVFVEYTGLKDKNGKEIYEGDIILGLPVEYHAPFFALKKESNDGTSYTGIQYSHELEVLGNIYENPELITNEQNENKSV